MTQITIPAQVVNGHLQHEKSLAELEGQHVLATLTVVPRDVDWQHWRGKLASMKSLADGWDSYCAPVPTPDSITQATDFLELLAKSESVLYRLAPSVVGGVGFTLKRANRKVYLEFRNTGAAHALFSDGVAEPQVEKVPTDVAGYASLIRKAERYLDE